MVTLVKISVEPSSIDWAELIENETWLTARRVKIPVRKMDTRHIQNTLRCLRGESRTKIPHNWNSKTHEQWIDILERELTKRQ